MYHSQYIKWTTYTVNKHIEQRMDWATYFCLDWSRARECDGWTCVHGISIQFSLFMWMSAESQQSTLHSKVKNYISFPNPSQADKWVCAVLCCYGPRAWVWGRVWGRPMGRNVKSPLTIKHIWAESRYLSAPVIYLFVWCGPTLNCSYDYLA